MQTLLDLANQLPAIILAIVLVVGAIATACTAIGAALAVFPVTRGAANVAFKLGADLAWLVSVLRKLPLGKAAKTTLVGFTALLLVGCGLIRGEAKSPCAGLYCLGVTAAGVPGEAPICYETEAQRASARRTLEAQGRKVVIK